jgi:hypothetical protein
LADENKKIDVESLGLDDLSSNNNKIVTDENSAKINQQKINHLNVRQLNTNQLNTNQLNTNQLNTDQSNEKSSPLINKILVDSSKEDNSQSQKDFNEKNAQNNNSLTNKAKDKIFKIGNFISDQGSKITENIKNNIDKIDIDQARSKVTNIISSNEDLTSQRPEVIDDNIVKSASNIIPSDVILGNDNIENIITDKYFFNKNYPKPTPKNPPDFLTSDIPPPLLVKSFSDENIHHPVLTEYSDKVRLLFNEIDNNDINEFNAIARQIYNVNIYNDSGDTPLLFAASLKRRTIVAILLAAGANPDLKNKLGLSAVNIAIKMGDYEMLKMIVESGANLDIRDNFGDTYLMQAVRIGYLPIIDYLADGKISLNAYNNKGMTAFDLARKSGNNVVMQLLTRYGSDNRNIIVKKSIINELQNKWR